ncbi:putative acyl-activating enzyme 2 [Capsicum chinense]|nr:putative acyl-activating enzyme 2 [Capsicum chinense]
MGGAPTVFNIIVNMPSGDWKPLPHKVKIMMGGSPPPTQIISRMEDLGVIVNHLYGPTEIHGSATINKTTPYRKTVKVQVDLAAYLPSQLELEVVNGSTNETRVEATQIQYDMLPKYCKTCKLEGHDESECRILHPELRIQFEYAITNIGNAFDALLEEEEENSDTQEKDRNIEVADEQITIVRDDTHTGNTQKERHDTGNTQALSYTKEIHNNEIDMRSTGKTVPGEFNDEQTIREELISNYKITDAGLQRSMQEDVAKTEDTEEMEN